MPNAGPSGLLDLRARSRARSLEQARALADAGRTAEALERAEQALAADPEAWELRIEAAGLALKLRDPGRAEQTLAPLAEAPEAPSEAVALLCRVWSGSLGQVERAEALLLPRLARQPSDPTLRRALAELHAARHAWAEAAALYEELLAESPATAELRHGLAQAYNEQALALHEDGRSERAVFFLRQAQRVEPSWSGLRSNLGQLFFALGRLGKARAELQEAERADPTDPLAPFWLARVERQAGDREAARAAYERALSLDASTPHARPELAALLYEQGDLRRAQRLLEQELRVDPDCPVCHHNLALCLADQGQIALAEPLLERSILLDPGDFRAHYSLATLLARKGELEASAAALRLALELEPEVVATWLVQDAQIFAALGPPEALRATLFPAPGEHPGP